MTLVLMALVFGLASCSDGSMGPAGFNAVGSWKLVSWTYDNKPITWIELYTFRSDKTWELTFDDKFNCGGTWDYTDTGVVLTGFSMGLSYREYDPANKELMFKLTNATMRYKKQ